MSIRHINFQWFFNNLHSHMLCFSCARAPVSLWYQGFGEVGRECTWHDKNPKQCGPWKWSQKSCVWSTKLKIVWVPVGLVDNGTVLRPYLFYDNANGIHYLVIIENHVIRELQRISGQMRNGVVQGAWWFQDGAPAHRRNLIQDRPRALYYLIIMLLDWVMYMRGLPGCQT